MNEGVFYLGDWDNDRDERTRRFFGEGFGGVRDRTVLIIGAGAVGNEVIKNLVMLGVRRLLVVDFDRVSLSNLNRCVFFRPEDHRRVTKVEAIVREVGFLSPETEVIPFCSKIQDVGDEVWEVPLVIVAVDNNEARHFINMRLLALDVVPFVVNGAMGRTFCETQVLWPGKTACLCCVWGQEYVDRLFARMVRQSCDEFFHETVERFPAISVISSILGGTMAAEAIKILAGLDSWEERGEWEEDLVPALGSSIRYDIRNHEASCGKIYPNKRCVEVFCRKRREKS